MLLHDFSFFPRPAARVTKDVFWHANFANVVKPTGDAEVVQVFVANPRLSPKCSAYAARCPELPFRKFVLESTLSASANTADVAWSSCIS